MQQVTTSYGNKLQALVQPQALKLEVQLQGNTG